MQIPRQTWIIYTNVRTSFAENFLILWKIFRTCGKFSTNGTLEKNFPTCENLKNFRHLRKNLRELLIYKLLSEISFNLICLLVLLVCVLTSELLKIATTPYPFLLLHDLYSIIFLAYFFGCTMLLYEANVYVLTYSWLFVCNL